MAQKGKNKDTTTKKKKTRWTSDEDELLFEAVRLFGLGDWSKIASHVQTKNRIQCHQHWHRVLNPNISKKKWTKEEDNLLAERVQELGEGAWKAIADGIAGRTDLQCRQHWTFLKKRHKTQAPTKLSSTATASKNKASQRRKTTSAEESIPTPLSSKPKLRSRPQKRVLYDEEEESELSDVSEYSEFVGSDAEDILAATYATPMTRQRRTRRSARTNNNRISPLPVSPASTTSDMSFVPMEAIDEDRASTPSSTSSPHAASFEGASPVSVPPSAFQFDHWSESLASNNSDIVLGSSYGEWSSEASTLSCSPLSPPRTCFEFPLPPSAGIVIGHKRPRSSLLDDEEYEAIDYIEDPPKASRLSLDQSNPRSVEAESCIPIPDADPMLFADLPSSLESEQSQKCLENESLVLLPYNCGDTPTPCFQKQDALTNWCEDLDSGAAAFFFGGASTFSLL